MPSLNTVLATATLLLSSVKAQDQYHIEPSTVPLSTRDNWCDQEKSTCPLICEQLAPGGYQVNDCDAMTLSYGCVCENGMSPNLSEYSLTLPFFICQEWGNQCANNCNGDNACVSDCRENHPCGALNPTRTTATTSTPAASGGAATSSAGQVFNGLGGDSGSDSDDSNPKNGASPLLQYGSLVGGLALAASVALGSLIL